MLNSEREEVMTMRKPIKNVLITLPVASVVLLALTASTTHATLLIYEPFDYTDVGDKLHGKGGSELGLTGSWNESGGNEDGNGFEIAASGLSYGSLPTTGKAVDRPGGPGSSRAERAIAGTVSLPNETWFSILLQETNNNAAFAIASDPFVKHAGTLTSTTGVGFGIYRTGGAGGTFTAAIWHPVAGAASRTDSSSPYDLTGTGLFVGKMTFGATDTLEVWHYASDLTTSTSLGTVAIAIDESTLDLINISDSGLGVTDEIRVGTSLNDVLVPEPATMALLAFGGIGILMRRRRLRR